MTLGVTVSNTLPMRLAYVAASIFTAASSATNLIYGWSKGADIPSSMVWAAVSLGVSIVFALSWPALLRALDQKQWSRALIVAVALMLTGAYSVSAALGSAMGGRENAASDERANADGRAKAQSSYERAKAEYDKLAAARPAAEVQSLLDTARAELKILGPARPSAELQALIDGIKQDPRSGDCVAIQGSTKMRCPKVAEWRTEKARAEKRERLTADLTAWIDEKGRSDRRDKLEAEMKSASAELAQLGPAKVANSDAQALASYLAAIGLRTTPDEINKLLVILAVLVIECGGGLALAVGMSLAGPDRQECSEQDRREVRPNPPVPELPLDLETAVVPSAISSCLPSRSPQPQRAYPRVSLEQTSQERLLALLRDRGGRIVGGQRALAQALGISKTQINRILKDLSAAGRVSIKTGHWGTTVRMS